MKTRRNKSHKKRKSIKNKRKKTNKKWSTAIDKAQQVLKRTGSLNQARIALRVQAAHNARKLFGPLV
jgi:hypothetical protein